MAQTTSEVKLIVNGKRIDGRNLDELRPVSISSGVVKEADGSAYVEWGGNKILAAVYGPRECIPRHEANPYKALIKCRYNMSPFASKEEHGRSGPSRRSIELSKVIREVFENVILAELFPKTQIDIYIEVLQANGGTRTASITAASVALADAGIPMRDMVSAVAVGKIEDKLVLDLSKEEDNFGQSDIPVAFSNRKKEILLLQLDGLVKKEELFEALNMAKDASQELYQKQRDALERVFASAKEKGNKEDGG